MKSGVAAYLIAVEAFLNVCGPPQGDLHFSSVIEEECGGNGMRAVLAAGYGADETLIGEPFWPHIGNGGVGVIWARLDARGSGRHAAHADEVTAPIEALIDAVGALRELEAELNASGGDPAFSDAFAHPYNLNLGEIAGGAWPSSVPTDAWLRIRLGFGRNLEPTAVQELVAERVAAVAPTVTVTFDGFRAHAYVHDPATPLAAALTTAHAELHGTAPATGLFTGTTDARYVPGPATATAHSRAISTASTSGSTSSRAAWWRRRSRCCLPVAWRSQGKKQPGPPFRNFAAWQRICREDPSCAWLRPSRHGPRAPRDTFRTGWLARFGARHANAHPAAARPNPRGRCRTRHRPVTNHAGMSFCLPHRYSDISA